MTINSNGVGAYRLARPNQYVATRAQFDDLQRQLTTKQKSETYAGLGQDRGLSLDLHGKLSSIDGWLTGIERTDVNLKLMTTAVESYAKLTTQMKTDVQSGGYVESSSGRTSPQLLAEERLKQALDMLNTDVNGRYLFSGRTSDVEPTASYSLIMDGNGAGQAGLKQLISERRQADLGADGLGRLTAGGTATTATLSEEAGNSLYGFKLSGATSSSSALTTAYTAGPPANLSVDVTGTPVAGDTLRIKLDLPDGTQTEITLTARGADSEGAADSTFAIGADDATTAANLRATITAALGKEASTTLSAASAQVSAKNFFDGSASNPPKRVAGPPFASATGETTGTAANTVIWYKGDDSAGSARATASTQVDQGQSVGTGARANEEAFRIGLAQFAVLAAETFPASDANSKARYEATTERVRDNLGFVNGAQKPSEIIVELGSAQTTLAQAKERHTATKNYLTTKLEGVENVSTEEVATQILALQTQLQASYQTTSMLAKMSLTNYL